MEESKKEKKKLYNQTYREKLKKEKEISEKISSNTTPKEKKIPCNQEKVREKLEIESSECSYDSQSNFFFQKNRKPPEKGKQMKKKETKKLKKKELRTKQEKPKAIYEFLKKLTPVTGKIFEATVLAAVPLLVPLVLRTCLRQYNPPPLPRVSLVPQNQPLEPDRELSQQQFYQRFTIPN